MSGKFALQVSFGIEDSMFGKRECESAKMIGGDDGLDGSWLRIDFETLL